MKLNRLLLVCAVAGAATATSAQQREALAIRLQGGLLGSFHSADFSQSGDIVDCGPLGNGSAWKPVGQAIIELPVGQAWGLALGIGFADRGATLSNTNTYPLRDTVNNRDVTMTTSHDVKANLNFIEIQPDVRFALAGTWERRTLGLVIGPRIGLPVTSNFTQTESVVSPSDAYFIVNGARTQQRSLASGPLTTRTNVMLAASAGIESFISVSPTISIVPAVSFDYFLTKVVNDAPWNMMGIRAELGIRFGIRPKAEEPVKPATPVPQAPPPAVTIAPEKEAMLAASITGFSGEVVTGNRLTASQPIVNAIFFDSTSADIPTSYRRSNDGSIPATDPVDVHAWVLPRIAAVMARNPQGRIVVEGATCGPACEPEGTALAERRARTVRDALVALGVDEGHITTKALVLPRVASNQDYVEGRAENRRVDIIVQNAPLQEYVNAEQFAELRGLAQVSMSGVSGPYSIRIDGKDTMASASTARIPVILPVGASQGAARLAMHVAVGGLSQDVDTTVDISSYGRRSIALATDGFEAILRFDYNSSELSEDVQGLLRQLTERLPDGSTITISGSTDILGSDQRNRELSEQRARVTEQFIRSVTRSRFTITTSTTTEKFPDTTPQGRFLNRSIRITARTP